MNDKIEAKLKLLPDEPGVYKMYDIRGELIYVGKAINLKNRVRQYFHSSKNQLPKVKAMVEHIDDLDFIIVGNETEALNLESNLIKQNKPYYNIMLKDDKHFPYIRIDFRQDFPAVQIVRKYKNDGAKYFGPFLSTLALREAITAVRDNFPIRHCKYDINKMIARGERPCLMYHIGRCCAPCTGKVSRETYHSYLKEVEMLLQGNSKKYEEQLTNKMLEESEKLNFEKAAVYRDRIRAMRSIGEKQIASSASSKSYDVFAFARDETATLAYGLFIRKGNVVAAESFNISAGEEPMEEISAQFLMQFYTDSAYAPNQINVSVEPENKEHIENCLSEKFGHSVHIHTPLRGEKHKQCELAQLNAVQTLARREETERRRRERGEGALIELAEIIGLDSIPYRIECFDNSHIRGTDTVGSMVVFIEGKPEKSLYRRFKTKQETNGDDYLAMKEHLTRRFERTLSGDTKFAELPDLLVVDGGRGQLDIALDVLAEYGLSDIPAVGLAEKNEEIILPDRKEPLTIEKNNPALHLLQRIRDEAHRFAITYHRNLHAKNSLYSELDEIKGIGAKRKRALYEKFLTVGEIAAASLDELKKTESMDTPSACAVYEYFHKDKDENSVENGAVENKNETGVKNKNETGAKIKSKTEGGNDEKHEGENKNEI